MKQERIDEIRKQIDDKVQCETEKQKHSLQINA